MPVEMTCAIPERKGSQLFDPPRSELVLKKLSESNSIAVKLWPEKNTKSDWGSEKSTTAFYKLAQNLCPMVHRQLGSGQY